MLTHLTTFLKAMWLYDWEPLTLGQGSKFGGFMHCDSVDENIFDLSCVCKRPPV